MNAGRLSDGPAGTDSSAVSPKGEGRPEAEEAGNDRGVLYASRSSAKEATAMTLLGRRT